MSNTSESPRRAGANAPLRIVVRDVRKQGGNSRASGKTGFEAAHDVEFVEAANSPTNFVNLTQNADGVLFLAGAAEAASERADIESEIAAQIRWLRQERARRLDYPGIPIRAAFDKEALPSNGGFLAEPARGAFLSQAARYRRQRTRAERLLRRTVAASVGVLIVMLLFSIGLLARRPEQALGSLAERVEYYRLGDGRQPAAQRLAEPLQPRIDRLVNLEDDRGFHQLPEEDQTFIRARLNELIDYRDYRDRLLQTRVGDLDSMADVRDLITQLTEQLEPPSPYGEEWAETEACIVRRNRLVELKALQSNVRAMEDWYHDRAQESEALRVFASGKPANAADWGQWRENVMKLTDRDVPPTPLSAQASRFDGVVAARLEWEAARQRLLRLSQVVQVLGIDESHADSDLVRFDSPPGAVPVVERWERLRQTAPGIAEFRVLEPIPDAIASSVRSVAEQSYSQLLKSGQDWLRSRLTELGGKDADTLANWRDQIGWLESSSQWQAWRGLARVLLTLSGSRKTDPIAELTDFLRKERWDITVNQARLSIPSKWSIAPTGPMTIWHGRDLAEPRMKVELKQENLSEGKGAPFRFAAVTGTPFDFAPGDAFFVRIPARKENEAGEWMLTWARNRSRLYQFERIGWPPRLHRASEPNTAGILLDDVILEIEPSDGVPKVPSLLPFMPSRAAP
jgi:hypothetical protein